MCGIAGMVVLNGSPATKLTKIKIAAALWRHLEERGKDASGILTRGEKTEIWKGAFKVSEALDRRVQGDNPRTALGQDFNFAIMHARATTKGSEKFNENNHPVNVGKLHIVHNGIISNDVELKKGATTEGTIPAVDTAGILTQIGKEKAKTMIEKIRNMAGEISGSMSCAMFDEEQPDRIFVWCNKGRPLVMAFDAVNKIIIFSSTREGLYVAGEATRSSISPYFGSLITMAPDNEVMEITRDGIMDLRTLKAEKIPTYDRSSYGTGYGHGGYDYGKNGYSNEFGYYEGTIWHSWDEDDECGSCRFTNTETCKSCTARPEKNEKGSDVKLTQSLVAEFKAARKEAIDILSKSTLNGPWWKAFRTRFQEVRANNAKTKPRPNFATQAWRVEHAGHIKPKQYMYAITESGTAETLFSPAIGKSMKLDHPIEKYKGVVFCYALLDPALKFEEVAA